MEFLFRLCDSRTLNVSPFCTLSNSSNPLKMAGVVKDLYGDKVPEYVQSMISPMRDRYLTDKMRQDEMLTTLTKVSKWSRQKYIFIEFL